MIMIFHYPKAITTSSKTSEKRVFTLVAIVVLFLVCNTIKLAINSYDMAHYTQVKEHFHFSHSRIHIDKYASLTITHLDPCLSDIQPRFRIWLLSEKPHSDQHCIGR